MNYKIYYRLRKEVLYFELSMPPEREVLISTGIKVPEKYWDSQNNIIRRGHSNADRDNINLKTKRNALEDIILKAQIDGRALTARQIKDIYSNGRDITRINAFMDEYY